MRALALFSGGLDSMLCIKLLTMQNIEVTALFIDIGFGGTKVNEEVLKNRAKEVGADFKLIDIKDKYLQEVLFSPKYGYGKHFNPCIDCHGFMFKTALNLLKPLNASFIITGEVIGQRPMSQRAGILGTVLKAANDENGLILRPLCAKNLPITTPEERGWVDREKLLDISGRGRQKQLSLAKKFGFKEYESPGGGCLLTLEAFANKIRDFVKYDTLNTSDIPLLKFGRHLRLPDGAKLVIGRNESDNKELSQVTSDKFIFVTTEQIGPLSLISKTASIDDKNLAARLVLSYCKVDKTKSYEVKFGSETLHQKPFCDKTKAKEYFIN